MIFSRTFTRLLTSVLMAFALILFQGCTKAVPSGVPPKPSLAEATPFSHEPLETIYPDIVSPISGGSQLNDVDQATLTILDDYILSASWTDTDLMSTTEQAVFWINLHNAIYLLESVRGRLDGKMLKFEKTAEKRVFLAGSLIPVLEIRKKVQDLAGEKKYTALLGDGLNNPFPRKCVSVLNIDRLTMDATKVVATP